MIQKTFKIVQATYDNRLNEGSGGGVGVKGTLENKSSTKNSVKSQDDKTINQ